VPIGFDYPTPLPEYVQPALHLFFVRQIHRQRSGLNTADNGFRCASLGVAERESNILLLPVARAAQRCSECGWLAGWLVAVAPRAPMK